MTIELYGVPTSAPTRAVALTLEKLALDYRFVTVDPKLGHTRTPEYLAMNPMHNIPTLKDDNFVLNESRAIVTYLAATYDQSGMLYPSHAKTRAVIDQRLYFDIGTLYLAFSEAAVSSTKL